MKDFIVELMDIDFSLLFLPPTIYNIQITMISHTFYWVGATLALLWKLALNLGSGRGV
jgi:hypothetical protein